MKHTAGPWRVEIDGTSTGKSPVIIVDDPRYDGGIRELAELETTLVRRGVKRPRMVRVPEANEIEANAALIAAAPDLFDAASTAILALRVLIKMCERVRLEQGAETARAILADLDRAIGKVERGNL